MPFSTLIHITFFRFTPEQFLIKTCGINKNHTFIIEIITL